MVENKKVRIMTHFFDKEEVQRLFKNIDLGLLSIQEKVRSDEKQRAHWIAILEKQLKRILGLFR